jgi:alpha-D-ribose 1-methylphosphonate 5-triphosphate diphosphatase PhnM
VVATSDQALALFLLSTKFEQNQVIHFHTEMAVLEMRSEFPGFWKEHNSNLLSLRDRTRSAGCFHAIATFRVKTHD